jgi:hypothetical protein
MEENLLSVINSNASNLAPYRNLKKRTWGIKMSNDDILTSLTMHHGHYGGYLPFPRNSVSIFS